VTSGFVAYGYRLELGVDEEDDRRLASKIHAHFLFNVSTSIARRLDFDDHVRRNARNANRFLLVAWETSVREVCTIWNERPAVFSWRLRSEIPIRYRRSRNEGVMPRRAE
jgi:hypothetical protein